MAVGSPSPGVARFLPLAGVAVVVTVLTALGIVPRWGGAPHLVAPPPLDLFADHRILIERAGSYGWYAAGLLASLAVRVLVLAVAHGRRFRAGIRFALSYYLTVLPVAALSAMLDFSAEFRYGLAVLFVSFLLMAPLPWMRASRPAVATARALRDLLHIEKLLLAVGAVATIGAVADASSPAGPVLLVPLSLAVTIAMACWIESEVGRARPRLRGGVLAFLAASVAALLVLMFVPAQPLGPPRPRADGANRPGSILLMSGIDSASGVGAILEIDTRRFGYTCEQTFVYSYRGPGEGQPQRNAVCPIATGAPYLPPDTLRPFDELVAGFRAQVTALPAPVVVLAHSQAIWIAWEALADGRARGVSSLVLVGTMTDNPISYPPRGERGRGLVGRAALRLGGAIARAIGHSVFDVDAPLIRGFVARPGTVRATMAQPLPRGVRVLSVPTVFDLPLMPEPWRVAGAVNACPVPIAHAELPRAPEFQVAVSRFLDRQPQPPCADWKTWSGPLGRPFNVPFDPSRPPVRVERAWAGMDPQSPPEGDR